MKHETKRMGKVGLKLERWGLLLEVLDQLGEELCEFWDCFGEFTRTKARDTSEYEYYYLSP